MGESNEYEKMAEQARLLPRHAEEMARDMLAAGETFWRRVGLKLNEPHPPVVVTCFQIKFS